MRLQDDGSPAHAGIDQTQPGLSDPLRMDLGRCEGKRPACDAMADRGLGEAAARLRSS